MTTDKHDEILTSYDKLMLEIRMRTVVCDALLSRETETGSTVTDYEAIALNLRKVAELIIYANLAGHKEEYVKKFEGDDLKAWKVEQVIRRIKGINADYYPSPSDQNKSPDGQYYLTSLQEGTWLTEKDLIKMYDKCSKLIHAKHPFGVAANYEEYPAYFETWLQKIANLLSHHTVDLADGEHCINCIISPSSGGNPVTVLMKKIDNGDGVKRLSVVKGGLTRPPLKA
jgi:hypothetical protein